MKALWIGISLGTAAAMAAIALLMAGPAATGQGLGAVIPDSAATPTVFGGSPGGATQLVGISPAFPNTNGYVIDVSPFSSTVSPALFPASLSGLSRKPGTFLFYSSGGFGDGGNLYLSRGARAFHMIGATGFSAVPGLAWDSTGSVLYGSAAVSSFGDGLIEIDPLTGVGTLVGSGYGSVVGVDAIAEDPTTGRLYGFTNGGYDGSPGDVIAINKVTGVGTDTGMDLMDSAGSLPPCTVAGAAFASNGTGYASIGCGFFFGGDILEFDTITFTFTNLGLGTGVGSMTDIEVLSE